MKKVVFYLLVVLSNIYGFAQNDSVPKTNPIIFAELNGGIARLDSKLAANGSISIHYQNQKNQFSLRFTETTVFNGSWVIFIPVATRETINSEYAFLYGRRWIDEGNSTSISLGISYNRFQDELDDITDTYGIQSNHIGLPFEANIKWFKSRKKRIRIYGLLPVGKPTGLGGSFGFKLSGNISKKSYVALGLTYSFGYHREY